MSALAVFSNRNDASDIAADAPAFRLGQSASGAWVLRDIGGQSAGLFLTRDAALRFARLEKPGHSIATEDAASGLEFDFAA